MRPIKLSVQAFGPFAQSHEIDFGCIGAAPLFGFYGPTGSGKTSVLDAICFALFGESSGGERKMEQLRSDHAQPEMESAVSLLFSVGTKSYFIHRVPDFEKKKKRGEGTTLQKHEAWLFDVTGMDLTTISFESNPGVLLADKKVTHAKEKIEEILGYNAAQFRQVVMLPQGKFRDFLTANSKDRSLILRQLFDLSLFEKLETLFKEKSKRLQDETASLLDQRNGILAASGYETIDAILTRQDEEIEEITTVKKNILSSEKDYQNAGQALEAGKKLAGFFVDLEKARHSFAALEAQKEEMKTAENRLKDGRRAQSIRHIAQSHGEALSEKKKIEDLLVKTVAELENVERDYLELEVIFKKSEDQQGERDDIEAGIRQNKKFLEILAAQKPLAEGLEILRVKQDTEQKQSAKDEKQLESLDKQLETAQQAVQQKDKNEHLLAQKTSELKLLEIERGQVKILAAKRSDVTGLHKKIEQAEKDWTSAEQAFDLKSRAFGKLEEKYRGQQAVYLAGRLEQGQPCPVCGGKDHPVPASLMEGEGFDQLDLKQAEMQRHESDAIRHKTASDLKVLENQLVLAEKERKTLEQQLKQSASLAELESKINTDKKLMTSLGADIQAAGDLPAKITDLTQKRSALAEQLEVCQKQLVDIGAQILQKETEAKTALRDIPPKFQEHSALLAFQAEMEKKRESALSAHKKARDAFQAIGQKKSSLADQKKIQQEAAKARAERFSEVELEFRQALAKHQFADVSAYETLLLGTEELEALAQNVSQYREQKIAAQGYVERAEKLVVGQNPPEMKGLEACLLQSDEALQVQRKTLGRLQEAQKVLQNTKKLYQEKTKEFDEADKVLRRALTLSDVANGKGDNQLKIRLVDWLLASYFEDVLAQANIRFSQMTNQRFSLFRSQNKAKGGRASGLDIDIYDAHNCKSRAAVSLSGGESFLAALSLALGLSDVVQQESGGVVIETIFIDEGFGHLDEEALDHALDALTNLSGNNRSVGIISHVEEVKRRVPAGFDIVPSQSGSTIIAREI